MTTPYPTLEDLDRWPEPALDDQSPDVRLSYQKRRTAVIDVVNGASVAFAAKHGNLSRKTLRKTLQSSVAIAPDGQQWGWRACIPYRARLGERERPVEPPEHATPGAFGKLLRAFPSLALLLSQFTGHLPTRDRRSPSFERFFKRFIAEARKLTEGIGYPFTSPDRGRRALLTSLKGLRADVPLDVTSTEELDATHARQFTEMFQFGTMERLEFDAHHMDADFNIEVEGPSGQLVVRPVTYVWLLLLIDAASRLILGWSLVFGRGYSQFDVSRICSRSLTRWEPRDLIVPEMRYPHDSGVGTIVATGGVQRGIVLAVDNAHAHQARLTVSNVIDGYKGVFHLGPAHVPETRGTLEAMFRQLEIGAIRNLPGGYEPRRNEDTPKRSTAPGVLSLPPVHFAAISDCLDVIVAGKNATQLDALQERTPIDVVRQFHKSGGWSFDTSLSEAHANRLLRVRVPVRIRGSHRKRRQPFVRLFSARYRSPALQGRYDLIGKHYVAELNFEDARILTLYDEKGNTFVRLRALPPWSRTRHDLDLRKLILRCTKRQLFSIAGADDAIAAFSQYVRKHAATTPMVADWAAKHAPAWNHAHASGPLRQSNNAITPRDGNFTFDDLKDPT